MELSERAKFIALAKLLGAQGDCKEIDERFMENCHEAQKHLNELARKQKGAEITVGDRSQLGF